MNEMSRRDYLVNFIGKYLGYDNVKTKAIYNSMTIKGILDSLMDNNNILFQRQEREYEELPTLSEALDKKILGIKQKANLEIEKAINDLNNELIDKNIIPKENWEVSGISSSDLIDYKKVGIKSMKLLMFNEDINMTYTINDTIRSYTESKRSEVVEELVKEDIGIDEYKKLQTTYNKFYKINSKENPKHPIKKWDTRAIFRALHKLNKDSMVSDFIYNRDISVIENYEVYSNMSKIVKEVSPLKNRVN